MIELFTGTARWRYRGLPVVPIRWVLLRDPKRRFDTQALLCTDPAQDPLQSIGWFVQRWQIEVTFQETRAHLGVETQRQWSDLAIARTTPCLLALLSLVTLLAASVSRHAQLPVASDAWYCKTQATFSDTLAAVRRHFWREQGIVMFAGSREMTELQPTLREGLAYALCQAA